MEEEAKRLNEKLSLEAKAKQEAMKQMLDKQEEEKSEVLQLHERMRRENELRKKESAELRNLLDAQKQLLDAASRELSREKEERETEIMRKDRELLRIKQEVQAQKEKSASDFEVLDRLVSSLKINLTASVYFNAIRNEPYLDGGEEYLTFGQCTVNEGGGMDPKSGMFTAPVSGAYVIALHVCTHDLKKALMSLRKNGVEISSLFDQGSILRNSEKFSQLLSKCNR
jgi:hypothetical protein